jgi:hypothetical protein
MKRQLALIILVLSLLCLNLQGCATQAQLEAQNIVQQASIAMNEVNSCFDAINSTNTGEMIGQFLLRSIQDPKKMEKFIMDRYVNEAETKALLEYVDLEVKCRKLALEKWSQVHPDLAMVILTSFSDVDKARADLITKKITIAEYNKRSEERHQRFATQWRQTVQSIENRLQYAHLEEVNRRAAAMSNLGKALQEWGNRQQQLEQERKMLMINALSRPKHVNCTVIGNTISCSEF